MEQHSSSGGRGGAGSTSNASTPSLINQHSNHSSNAAALAAAAAAAASINQSVPLIPHLPNPAAAAAAAAAVLPQQIITSGTRKDCIRLRGLPYEAQVENILEFLGDHAKNIVYQGVHMVYNAQVSHSHGHGGVRVTLLYAVVIYRVNPAVKLSSRWSTRAPLSRQLKIDIINIW